MLTCKHGHKLKRRWGFYISILALFYLICAMAVLSPALLLWRSGEAYSPIRIVDWQTETGGIWDPSIISNGQIEHQYKEALVYRHKPEVMVMGSSRVLGYRNSMFATNMTNVGRGIKYSLIDDEVRRLVSIHKPQVILYAPDFWHFTLRSYETDLAYQSSRANLLLDTPIESLSLQIVPREIYQVWLYLIERKISWKSAFMILLNGRDREGPRLGLRGMSLDIGGYGPDGSYYYLKEFQQPKKNFDLFNSINTDPGTVPEGELDSATLSSELLERVRRAAIYAEEEGIAFVTVLLPVPSGLRSLLIRDERFASFYKLFSSSMQRKVIDAGGEFFDFTDSRILDAPDREFIDFGHPGSVMLARTLLAMSKSSLGPYIDGTEINSLIQNQRGIAQVPSKMYQQLGVQNLE